MGEAGAPGTFLLMYGECDIECCCCFIAASSTSGSILGMFCELTLVSAY